MRNRSWSDLIIVAMIALCVSTVAKPQAATDQGADGNIASSAVVQTNLADAAQSLAVAVLLTGEHASGIQDVVDGQPTASTAADRAMANAAEAAGEMASGIEMPFFSFGGDASAE